MLRIAVYHHPFSLNAIWEQFSMCIYYLYKKTHKITGLKYLGITKQDPYKYKGSGKVWSSHIKLYGYLVDTEILLETSDRVKLSKAGRYYSNLWNIVKDNSWANCIPETCGGPGGKKGVKKSLEMRAKMKVHNHGSNTPCYGKLWWTDGSEEIKSKHCPGPQWTRGRSKKVKDKVKLTKQHIDTGGSRNPAYGLYWWTNGTDTVRARECPNEGWVRGTGSVHRSKCINKR